MRYISLVLFSLTCLALYAFAQDTPEAASWLAPILAKVPFDLLAWVFASLALLTAISKFLAFVASKTANTVDDKIALWFGKICGWIGKLLDIATANERPK